MQVHNITSRQLLYEFATVLCAIIAEPFIAGWAGSLIPSEAAVDPTTPQPPLDTPADIAGRHETDNVGILTGFLAHEHRRMLSQFPQAAVQPKGRNRRAAENVGCADMKNSQVAFQKCPRFCEWKRPVKFRRRRRVLPKSKLAVLLVGAR
jgi:hypothetical protein